MAQPSRESPDAHVIFDLEVDEGGWPPVSAERVWATHLDGERYCIENAPWFVRDLAVGDIVRARAFDEESHPTFIELLERSDHITIRLICFRDGPLGGDLGRAAAPFVSMGAWAEGAPQYNMLALDIEPSLPLADVKGLLERGSNDGTWAYEEGRITPAWLAA
jgi:hypothetical protein